MTTKLTQAQECARVIDLPPGQRLCIDEDCPSCGWPERWFDPAVPEFGCNKCDYRSQWRDI